MDEIPPRPDFLPPGFGTIGHRDFVEIVVPDLVAFTPETWGWYLLFGLLAVAVTAGIFRALHRYRRNAYRRAALVELRDLRSAAGGPERAQAVARLPVLLKRAALAAFSRHEVAGLSGDAWLAFLERSAPGALNDEAKRTLLLLVLRNPDEVPQARDRALFDGAERWLRGHHV